jgi:hypothetical protein
MKIWKYILVMMLWVVTMSPCGHADLHFDHSHDHDPQVELYSDSSESCKCHAHNPESCIDAVDLDAPERGFSGLVEIPESQVTIASYPKVSPAVIRPVLQVSGNLISLRTVQLLI